MFPFWQPQSGLSADPLLSLVLFSCYNYLFLCIGTSAGHINSCFKNSLSILSIQFGPLFIQVTEWCTKILMLLTTILAQHLTGHHPSHSMQWPLVMLSVLPLAAITSWLGSWRNLLRAPPKSLASLFPGSGKCFRCIQDGSWQCD